MQPEIIKEKISPEKLKKHADIFGDMIKVVVDIDQKIMAIGGEMHADSEAILLTAGSQQENLWGANIYPEKTKADRLEYTSLINIRPAAGNRSMEIQDEGVKEKVESIVSKLIS
ncbi:MAG: hypothetical protein HQ530_05465 [Parcubacteria group bacterium]|nr:hypothetical protein [Parcubacteria group bacterium]